MNFLSIKHNSQSNPNMMKKDTNIRLAGMCLAVLTLVLFSGTLFQAIGQQNQDNMIFGSHLQDDRNLYEVQVSIQVEQASIPRVFQILERQMGLRFLYNKDKIENSHHQLDLDFSQAMVADVLMEVADQTGLRFRQINRIISVGVNELKEPELMDSELQETVRGTVVDAQTGESLPGVNIILEGTSTGTTTDLDGNFELGVPNLQETLVFTFIGYTTQTIPIEGRTEINIELMSAVAGLDDVVVTAFGIARERASLGYSVTEIGGDGLTQARDINVASSLTGRIAGVNASGMGTGPGASSRVIIRGAGSIDGDNQPLYVVNGMPITNDARTIGTTGGSRVDRGDGISNINPDDIESISVLKGGAAAALYGSDAANGVILITTKQGTRQDQGIGVEFNSNFMVGTINRFPDYQYEYGQGDGRKPQSQSEAFDTGRLNWGVPHDGLPTVQFDGEERPYSPINVRDNMLEFYRPATTATNTLAFSGGTESILYRLSLSNLDAESIQPNSGYSRQTVNLNVRGILSDRLSVESTMQYNYEEGTNRPGHNYAPENVNWGVTLLANTVPIQALAPGYDPETGREMEWQSVNVAHNPYYTVNRIHNSDSRNRVMAQGKITYNILPNLYVQGDLMRDFEVWEAVNYVPIGTAFTPDGNYRSFNEDKARTNVRTIMGYNVDLTSDINISAMAGGNIERVDNESYNLTGVDFIVPDWISPANLGTISSSRGNVRRGTNSLFGSADFNYREMVYLNLTGRQDWFSTLNIENNRVFYPSIGTSVVLSRIMSLPDAVSYARVRASWSEVGASTVSPYAINQTYGYREGGHMGRPVQTTGSALANPDLRPLVSRTWEGGIDLEFFNGRLGFDITFYDRLNRDDMITTSLPLSSGASSIVMNVGEISNRGVELLVTGEPVRTDRFSWNVSYNLGYNKNEVLTLAPGQAAGVTSLLGRDLSTTFAWSAATTEDGTPIYNSNSNLQERVMGAVGPGVPPTTMGLENSFNYRNLSFSFLLDGKFGNHFFSRHYQYMHRFGHSKQTLPGRDIGLQLEGVDQNGNPYSYNWAPELMHVWYNNQGNRITRLSVQDGSFVKLRSLILSYNLPVERVDFLGVQSAQLSLVGRNLAILFSRTPHFDPEQSYDPNSNTQNFAGTQLPRTREIGMNLRVNF